MRLFPPMIPYANFRLQGYRFEAFIPESDEEAHQFTLTITLAGREIRGEHVRMLYPCLFSVDVADLAVLEERTEEIIMEFGLEQRLARIR
jgi:hypothetical protein